ncbi:cadmium-translocating P-type ATPase [bacterium]|nr:cadmium-translocating P-type ATPase [bacterium]
MPTTSSSSIVKIWNDRGNLIIAFVATLAIATHLVLRFMVPAGETASLLPLWIALLFGGIPLVFGLLMKVVSFEFGSDLLAGISIITAVLLGEYLAGTIVVLMLSGGEALEQYAVRSASSVLRALAKRLPSVAHRKEGDSIVDIPLDRIVPGDLVVLFPHDICPADGVVVEGHGVMDESFLTGEPFMMMKTPGSEVISGAINGETAVTVRTTRPAADSRYAKIMKVMQSAEQNRPHMRRLGDQLGAFYTPVALFIAFVAWGVSGEAYRFLAVLVVATPCPLLIAIPVAIISAISLSARRGIIIKNPAVLEQISTCRTAIFDKTGTLTYGRPKLIDQIVAPGREAHEVLALVASVERYSKHPLATAIHQAAEDSHVILKTASSISEPPGAGLQGEVEGRVVEVTGRKRLTQRQVPGYERIPASGGGLECVILIDGEYAALYRFRDAPRAEGVSFIRHLKPSHNIEREMIISGDRESEVRYLADQVGIKEVYASKSPEEKVELVRSATANAKTLYVGDGINDAPALLSATVGIAIGQNSDITSEAADVVIMDSSLEKVDEFLHISERMRRIALESAIGGMALSVVGMGLASVGLLAPVAGAITQEVIDVFAVLNAVRTARTPRQLTDFK